MSEESRWTYTGGSRAEGVVIYDDGHLHSFHDTDPARGQHNAYDLVRLHRFGNLDAFDADTPIGERPSARAMEEFCRGLTELQGYFSAGFTALPDDQGGDEPASERLAFLPGEILRAVGLCTDLENARRIQRNYGRQIIAVAGSFYIWQETHWKADIYEGHISRRLANLSNLIKADYAALKDMAGAQPTEQQAKELVQLWNYASKSADKNKMDACKELLRKLLDFSAAKLNVHKQLFNARNCTLNLETGESYTHKAEDFLTACAPTDYEPDAKCPRFDQFMSEIFDGDAEMIGFMKRWLGYCITGETRAQAMVFHVGKSGNGKSTLMRVMEHVLGGYAMMGARSLLTGKSDIKNDVATLVGKRMVTLNETKQNEEFDQAQIKELSGGDKLTARLLFKEHFEFAPTHKLQIFTNHEPNFTGDDAGIWRRVLLVRYRVRYGTPDQVASGEYQKLRDEKLEDALKAEAPGILRWLVEGAREWYAAGLRPPAAVLKDTKALRDEQDIMEQFLRERTVLDPEGRVPYNGSTESLYAAYKGWISENGHRPLGRGRFIKRVREATRCEETAWKEKGAFYRGFRGMRLVQNGDLTE